MASSVAAGRISRHFLWRRLHSLLGVLPVGGFMVFHLYEHLGALQGAQHYDLNTWKLNHMPLVLALELLVIILPLYAHAIYGVVILLNTDYRKALSADYVQRGRSLPFVLQRVTGVVTLVFVTYHLWQFTFQKWIGTLVTSAGDPMSGLPTFELISRALANNWMFAFYLLGTVSAAFHLGNGLYTFLITWGITVGPRAQRVSRLLCNAFFLAVAALGVTAAFAFRVR